MAAMDERFRFGRIWILGLGMLGISLVWHIYNAYIPILLQAGRPDFPQGAGVRGFGLGTTLTGFIMTLDNIAALLILPYIGVVSDRLRSRWGRRKPFIAMGAPVAALAFAAIPFTVGASMGLFMAAIVLMLLAMDLFRTPVVALMPDLTPPHQRSPANGILSLMSGVGSVLALGVGGALFRVSPAAPFLFGAAGMIVALLLLLALIREPAVPAVPAATEAPPGVRASIGAVLADRDRSVLLLLGAIFAWCLGTSALEVFFTSFAVKEFSLTGGQAMSLMAFFALSGVVGALPAGALGVRLGRRRCLMTGLALLIGLLSVTYTVSSLGMMRLLLVGMGLSWSLLLVNALPMVLDFAPPERSGAYTGLFFFAMQLASVIGPVLSGRVLGMAGTNYRFLFLYVPCTMAVALGLMLGIRRTAPARDPAPATEGNTHHGLDQDASPLAGEPAPARSAARAGGALSG
jgi:maltose/moltooligosaccharide transporter